MAATLHARWGGVLLVAGVLSQAAICPLWSAEPVLLLSDYPAALAQAKKEGRLLFVLHLAGDFTTSSQLGQEGEAYRALALADERVASRLSERYVTTFRQVGTPATMNFVSVRGKLKPREPDRQHTIAYICLPDERVIHFVPGFVAADQLLAELAWAESCYFDLVRFPLQEQPPAARQMHLAAAGREEVAVFSRGLQSRWFVDTPQSYRTDGDLAAAVRNARFARTARLNDRFGGQGNSFPSRAFFDALADHGSLDTSAAHLVLAEFPLVPLSELQQPLYETWFRDHFWQISSRRDQVKDWFQNHVGNGKPVLLAITSPSLPTDDKETRPIISLPLSTNDELPLAEFDMLEISLDELTVLFGDLSLPPLTAERAKPPQFLVFDRSGRRKPVLTTSDGISKLRASMRAAALPGVSATRDDKGRRNP